LIPVFSNVILYILTLNTELKNSEKIQRYILEFKQEKNTLNKT
jgi:hypothetical protein